MAKTPQRLTPRASFHESVHSLMDFCTEMIGFLFGGPDSGQHYNRRPKLRFRKEGLGCSELSVNQGFVGVWKVF